MKLLSETEFLATTAAPMRRLGQDAKAPFHFWDYFDSIPSADFENHECSAGTVAYVWQDPQGRFQHVLVDSEDKNVFMVLVLDLLNQSVLGHRLLDLNRDYYLTGDSPLHDSGTAMNRHAVKHAITPLRLIFWGALLCIFDFTFTEMRNGQGFRFDILNDTLGSILIAVGVFRLSALSVHDRYATAMKFVQVVSVLAVLDSIRDHFIMPLDPVVQFALNLLGVASLVAIVVFCVAMRWFCENAGLREASTSWSTTTKLFVFIYLFPMGLFYAISALAIVSNSSFNLNFGAADLLLVPVFLLPLIHLFVSASRMKRAAETAAVVE